MFRGMGVKSIYSGDSLAVDFRVVVRGKGYRKKGSQSMAYLAFVIEDHVDVSLLYLRALVEAGFQPAIIRDGEEAMARLAKENPALVILDLHVPKVSGETILDYIRSQERLKQTKVIIATGDARYSEADYPKADLFLLKPITYSQMMDFADRFKGTWPARD